MTASGTGTPFDSTNAAATLVREEARAEPTTAASPRHASFPIERDDRRSARAESDRAFGRRFLRDLGRGVLVVVLLHLFVVQISVVRGLSMQPSLSDGDRLIVDRLTYSFGDVDRFDVVVLRNPRNHSVDYVKRVVGLPGERVSIRAGVVMINDEPLIRSPQFIGDSASMSQIIVPDDHYFVLGDNRPVSCDSREFGLVQRELLKGKVRVRFWPLTRLSVF